MNAAFPWALSIGMTPEQYWYDEVTLLGDYAEAEILRQKQRNTEQWFQGYYVYRAIGAFSEILPAFPKKTAKIHEYLSAPTPWTADDRKAQEERKAQKKYDALRAYLRRSAKKE